MREEQLHGWARPVLVVVAALAMVLGVTAGAWPAAAASSSGRHPVPTVEVSPLPAQTMEGFGASGAWWPADLVRFPRAVQEHVADLLFAARGIELSVYRYNIGGGGAGVAPSSPRSVQSFLEEPGVYDWSADPGGTRFLELAHDHRVPILEGFVNSAPAAWTTDHLNCGGQLVPGDERAFASYLAEVVHHLATSEGIRLDDVSPMNEPDNSFAGCGQEGMAVPVGQRAAVVSAVGRALARRAPFARVIADESSLASLQFLPEVPVWLTVPGTAKWVASLVHHGYEFPTDAQAAGVAVLGTRFGKPLWMTEICCYDGKGPLIGFGQQYDPTMTSGLWLADTIDQDLAVIGDAQFDWWTALSDSLGCDPVSDPSCATTVNTSGWNDALLYYDPGYARDGNVAIYPTKRYYVLGNFSRYVRPGAVRHPVTGVPPGLRVLAFQHGRSWTVVVVDDDPTGSAPLGLRIGLPAGAGRPTGAVRTSATEDLAPARLPRSAGGVATTRIPAHSVTTFTFGH